MNAQIPQNQASSGPHVTLHSGGIVAGSLHIASSGFGAFKGSIVNATIKTNKLFHELKQVDYCHNRRGGPKSKVFCEVPKTVPHDIHSGRSNTGRWFSWKEREHGFSTQTTDF